MDEARLGRRGRGGARLGARARARVYIKTSFVYGYRKALLHATTIHLNDVTLTADTYCIHMPFEKRPQKYLVTRDLLQSSSSHYDC